MCPALCFTACLNMLLNNFNDSLSSLNIMYVFFFIKQTCRQKLCKSSTGNGQLVIKHCCSVITSLSLKQWFPRMLLPVNLLRSYLRKSSQLFDVYFYIKMKSKTRNQLSFSNRIFFSDIRMGLFCKTLQPPSIYLSLISVFLLC